MNYTKQSISKLTYYCNVFQYEVKTSISMQSTKYYTETI